MPEEILPPPFPEYEVANVGTVIAHEGDSYIVRMLDGRVCGFLAAGGTPSEANAAAHIAAELATPTRPPFAPIFTSADFLERFTSAELVALFTSGNNNVLNFRVKLIAAKEFPLDAPKLANGLTLLVNQSIITAQRKIELLTP